MNAPTDSAVNEQNDRLPLVNDVIVSEKTKRQYRLLSILGNGGYGTVFKATDENRMVAIKTEKYSRSMLRIEASVLKTASQQRCTRILDFIEYGICKPHYCYLIMPLLGKDLSALRNEQKNCCFSRPTVLRVGVLSLLAIQELHEKCHYVSRDIKPGNFAIGLGSQDRQLFLFDFGLARKYVDQNKNIIPARKDVGWRGTTRYGSLQAHLKQDLGRKDDVESWFYLLVELTKGSLPWRLVTDRSTVQASKMSVRMETRAAFLQSCPPEYDEILIRIDSLSFSDTPNYEKIIGLLEEVFKQSKFSWDMRFDWEAEEETCSTVPSSGAFEDENANIDQKT